MVVIWYSTELSVKFYRILSPRELGFRVMERGARTVGTRTRVCIENSVYRVDVDLRQAR